MQKNFLLRFKNLFKRTYPEPEKYLKPVYVIPQKRVKCLAAILPGYITEVDTNLIDCFFSMVVSPLHDCDLTKSSYRRPPHYHCLIDFDCPRRLDAAVHNLEVFGFNCVSECTNPDAYIRYMTHKDHLDMVQYNEKDIRYIYEKGCVSIGS